MSIFAAAMLVLQKNSFPKRKEMLLFGNISMNVIRSFENALQIRLYRLKYKKYSEFADAMSINFYTNMFPRNAKTIPRTPYSRLQNRASGI